MMSCLGSGETLRRTKHLLAVAFVLTVCTVSWSGPSDAATWLVRIDGSGDAMGIGEGILLASLGDTVLVGPGTYFACVIPMTNGVTLISELGPLETRVVPDIMSRPSGAIDCARLPSRTEISGFWFDGFVFGDPEEGAIGILDCQNVHITHNLFTNCRDAGISVSGIGFEFVTIMYNTFVGNKYAIHNRISGICFYNIIWDRAIGLAGLDLACNDLLNLDDSGGDDRASNFQADPLFCGGQGAEALRIQPDSPCTPENSPIGCPELLGALPVGCPGVPVEESTWGQIKSIFKR